MKASEPERLMAILAGEHRAARAPVRVERAVLAEFDASRRRGRKEIAAVVGISAIAAMLMAGAFVIRERPARHAVAVKATPQRLELRTPPGIAEGNEVPVIKARRRKHPLVLHEDPVPETTRETFVAIPYTVPLAPEERATVVRVTLSASAIAAVGFPLPAINPGHDTLADVLVGEDGRAHAIRIVVVSDFR